MNSDKGRSYLAEIDNEIADLESAKAKLLTLRHVVAEHMNGAESPPTTSSPDLPTPNKAIHRSSSDRVQTVAAVMDKVGRPMGLNEVIDAMWAEGHDLNYKGQKINYYNVLSTTMHKSGKFRRVKRGVWWFVDRAVPGPEGSDLDPESE